MASIKNTLVFSFNPQASVLVTPVFIFALCWPLACIGQVQDEAGEPIKPTSTALRTTLETWKLPGGEKMGMLGGTTLFDVSDQFKLGLGTYGAVRGERGGFITLGAAGEYQQRISPSLLGHAGLFVGAGGGRGGATLSGGGLMLRGDLGLTYQTNGYGNLGVGISRVSFPSSSIRSTQPYVLYEYPFYSLLDSGWGRQIRADNGSSPLAANRQEFSVVARSYRIPAGVVRDDGRPQTPKVQLLGVEWLSYLDDRWYLKLESEGAAGGESAGYMQILAGAGYRMPITRTTAVKIHAAAGPAGGNLDTGGGLLLDAGLALQQNINSNTALELSVGKVAAPSKSFKATSFGVKLTHQFGTPAVGASPVFAGALGTFAQAPLRLRAASQTYLKGAPNWRSNFADLSVSNLGAQLDYFVSPHLFLTGQGLAAYSGRAGAYMTGQVGLGGQLPVSQNWFVEGEALIGAAGGGGLTVGGGLVRQVNASAGYRLSKSLSVMGTAGQVAALRGDFKANVVGISLGYQFTGFSAY